MRGEKCEKEVQKHTNIQIIWMKNSKYADCNCYFTLVQRNNYHYLADREQFTFNTAMNNRKSKFFEN